MNDAPLLSSVVHAMGLLVIAQDPSADDEEQFVWVGQVPAWAERFGCSAEAACDPTQSFAFLEFFLGEAQAWWEQQNEFPGADTLRSEVWAEPDRDGVDQQLEAMALRVGGQGVLVIAGVGLEFSQAQSILQTARERRLTMDRELAVRQMVEDQLRHRVAQRTEELDASNRQLRALASEVALAEQRERHRLAIGLHDHIGQLLAVTKMRLSSEAARSDDATKQRLNDTIALVADAIDATRSLTFELSPPMLYELGLVPTLASLIELTAERHAPLICSFDDDGQPKPLATDVEVLLFQVVRELITNALKHARAISLSVTTRRQGPTMQLIVEDDGCGFVVGRLDRPTIGKGGFGLLSVRERLSHFGATLRVESPAPAPGNNTPGNNVPGSLAPRSNAGMASGGEGEGEGGGGTRATIVVPLESD